MNLMVIAIDKPIRLLHRFQRLQTSRLERIGGELQHPLQQFDHADCFMGGIGKGNGWCGKRHAVEIARGFERILSLFHIGQQLGGATHDRPGKWQEHDGDTDIERHMQSRQLMHGMDRPAIQ